MSTLHLNLESQTYMFLINSFMSRTCTNLFSYLVAQIAMFSSLLAHIPSRSNVILTSHESIETIPPSNLVSIAHHHYSMFMTILYYEKHFYS